jgi:hypothetical protein
MLLRSIVIIIYDFTTQHLLFVVSGTQIKIISLSVRRKILQQKIKN